MSKRHYEDDDGRTVVDMSGIDRPRLLVPRLPKRPAPPDDPTARQPDRPWEDHSVSHAERRWYVLGALKAALVIALAFILGLGLVIALILFFSQR